MMKVTCYSETPEPPPYIDTAAGRLLFAGWTIGVNPAIHRDYPGEGRGGDPFPVYRLNVRPGTYR